MLGTPAPRNSNNWWKIALAGIFLMIFACVCIGALYFALFTGNGDPQTQAISETVSNAANRVNNTVAEPNPAYASAPQQTGKYDLEWLRSIASQPNMVDLFVSAFNTTEMWTNAGGAGTYDIVAYSAVLGIPDMTTGNDPSFEQLAPNLWFTSAGGRFGATKSFMAFQLEGAVVTPANQSDRPQNIDQMLQSIGLETDYGRIIAKLDVEWTSSDAVINRWGTSGPLELLTAEQLSALENAGLPLVPVLQQLPGHTVIWGELAPGEFHSGLVQVGQNVYITTCEGGVFATFRGFRAMQYAPPFEGALISDTTGCNGAYPPLDPNNPVSVAPLGTNPSIGAQ